MLPLITGRLRNVHPARALLAVLAAAASLTASGAVDAAGADSAPALFEDGIWHFLLEDGTTDSFAFGEAGDLPLLGDWDCDGIDTVAMYRPGTGLVYARDDNAAGAATREWYFGMGTDIPVAGDWDGDGCDSLAVVRGRRVYVANGLGTVGADFHYTRRGGRPLAGDFDGDGADSIAFRRGDGRILIFNHLAAQPPDAAFHFGLPSDRAVIGDWDGDGVDTVGVYRGESFWLPGRGFLPDSTVPLGTGRPLSGIFSPVPREPTPARLPGTAQPPGGATVLGAGADIAAAVAAAAPGTTLFLEAGDYPLEDVVLGSDVSIVGQADAGGASLVHLSGSGSIRVAGSRNVTLRGLRVSSTGSTCIEVSGASGVTIAGSEIGTCAGVGIDIIDSRDITITRNHIHPEHPVTRCCDTGDGVHARTSSDILIEENVIAYGESNVQFQSVADATVRSNFLLNPMGPYPRGQQVQVWQSGGGRSRNIVIDNNYGVAGLGPRYRFGEVQEDAINLGFVDGAIVSNNYMHGGHSPRGCGYIADESANNVQVVNNIAHLTAQCGIGIASGTNHIIDGNYVLNSYVDDPVAGNTAIYVWDQYPQPCGPVTVTNNVATAIRADGGHSGFWDGGNCGRTTLANNTFGAAGVATLEAVVAAAVPPVDPGPYRALIP